MKIAQKFIGIMNNKKTNDWQFVLTPGFYIRRSDVFADEAAYYIGFGFLWFYGYILVTKKKTTDLTDLTNYHKLSRNYD